MYRNSKRPKSTSSSSSSPTKRAKTAPVSSTAALSSDPATCTLPVPLIAAASASEYAATSTVAEIAKLVSVFPTPTASDAAPGTRLRTNAELLDAIDLVLDERGEHADAEVAAAPEAPAAAVARPASLVPLANWTVKNPGKVAPPTCNDYDTWTVVQLRKECTERKLRLPRTTPKSEQIKQLRAHDAARMAVQSTVDDEYLIEPSLRKTKHCCIRLLNIIFSDYFASRIASSEDTATRAEIDAGEVGYRMRLWKEITEHFCNNKTDYNGLFVVDDPRFDGINPAYIVMDSAARLYDMWKKVMSKYGKADAKFFVSGQNSEEFFNFCEGSLDVLYLKACLDIKPELRDYVRGGMRQEDEVDSLDLQNSSHGTTTARAPKWQDGILKTINRLADIVAGGRTPAAAPVAVPAANLPTAVQAQDEAMLIDRIGKLHHLIEQVKERQRKAEHEGQTDAALANSLALYQQRLQLYESRLAALE